jgi:2-C-methyl-D-erythritol 2,4-cyclodiphosphate synthase
MIRIGFGWDFHQLIKKRPLRIGGVHIPFHKGEKAHSDGDVLLHAITDALLGAAGIADIGELFPPEDNTWKNASSAYLLQEAWKKVEEKSWRLVNIDAVLILEKPKLLVHRETIRQSIASILGCKASQIFVKAKTHEKLGPVGRGKGIEAHVVCLLEKSGT